MVLKENAHCVPVQMQALERMATVHHTILLAENEVTSDIVAAHLKNFYPHMLFYASQSWSLPAHTRNEILTRCQVRLAWPLVGRGDKQSGDGQSNDLSLYVCTLTLGSAGS